MNHDEYISEGYALGQQSDEGAEHEREPITLSDKVAFDRARNAKVGSIIKCPGCGKSLTKRSYQHSFCRSKGQGNCKDRYYNATAGRIDRTLRIGRERAGISTYYAL